MSISDQYIYIHRAAATGEEEAGGKGLTVVLVSGFGVAAAPSREPEPLHSSQRKSDGP